MDRNIAKLFPTCHNKKQEKSLISHSILMIAITKFIIRNVLFSLSFYSLNIFGYFNSHNLIKYAIFFQINLDYSFNLFYSLISNTLKISRMENNYASHF